MQGGENVEGFLGPRTAQRKGGVSADHMLSQRPRRVQLGNRGTKRSTNQNQLDKQNQAEPKAKRRIKAGRRIPA